MEFMSDYLMITYVLKRVHRLMFDACIEKLFQAVLNLEHEKIYDRLIDTIICKC